jgi:hypothetical protein
MSASGVDLEHLAGQLQRALSALEDIEALIDRHALFLTTPGVEEMRRWSARLSIVSGRVADVYEYVDDTIAELAQRAADARVRS